MKISLQTLGCKLNQAESQELKQNLLHEGFSIVPFKSGEDAAIIRACGVTGQASQTTREMIRQIKRQGAYIIATGCLENKNLPEIDFIGANNQAIVKHLVSRHLNHLVGRSPAGQQNTIRPANTSEKTRAFVKIQTGCNFQCAYCAIPFFRGKSRSVPTTEVIEKINQIVKNGCKEVTLTGVNICQYKDKAIDLAGLIKEILAKTKIQRLRLGSLDPRLISNKLTKLYTNKPVNQSTNKRLLPHWHLSLQSGSDTVLKRMARGYTTKQYEKIVNQLRQNYPLFSFTTDIIVGFPGETAKEFEETCEFVKKIGFTKIHIFPFSPRPNTPAARLKPVTNRVVTERVKKLTKIAEQTVSDYKKQFIGLTRPVLFENKTKSSRDSVWWEGYAPEYVRIKYKSKQNLQNKIRDLKINSSLIHQ